MTAPAVTGQTDMASLQAIGAEVIARDRWRREQILAFQRQRVEDLITHAVSASPYYAETIGPLARGGVIELERLPTLPKATLIEQFDRIVTDPRLRLAELEEHATGNSAGEPFLGEFRVYSTSGTSGLRALIAYSLREFDYWVAVSLRLFARLGVGPETRLAAIGAPNPLHITRQLFAAFRSGRTGAPQVSVLTPLDEIVEALNAYQPEIVIGYTSIAALLAQEQLAGRLRIAPRILGVSSEVLTDEARRWIDEAWGIRPAEVYASTETLYMASSTPPHPGLHLYEDLAVIEVVDEDNRPVAPGEPGYKVLVTNLVNRTQPLIRYELSDSVTLADGPDSSGLPFERIARIDGRSDDILRFPARAGGDVAVHPYRLRTPFTTLSEVRQYQILQRRERLEVRVVLNDSSPRDTSARVREALAATLGDAGAVPPAIEVVPVEAIERESGHAAKLKLVKKLG
jgi:putative adenylate-forming enzyme